MQNSKATTSDVLIGATVLAPIVGLAWSLVAVHDLWSVAPGSAIRPMGLAVTMVFTAFATPGITLLLATASLGLNRAPWRILIAIFAMLLAMTIWPMSDWYFDYIVAANNLTLKP